MPGRREQTVAIMLCETIFAVDRKAVRTMVENTIGCFSRYEKLERADLASAGYTRQVSPTLRHFTETLTFTEDYYQDPPFQILVS